MRMLIAVLAFVAIAAAAVAGLYFAPVTREELRDAVIIAYGVLGVLLMAVLIAAALGVWFAVRVLSKKVGELIDDPLRPTLDEVRASARNVRGTTEFIADSTVHPLIRALAVARGVRRGLARVSGLARRRR